MTTLEGWIARPHGVQRGRLVLGERIERLDLEGRVAPEPDDDAPRYLPGFVDAHVHGGGGGDTMDGPGGVRTLARHHLAHGTTTLLPTTITHPWEDVLAALDGVAEVRAEAAAGDALPDLPGAHLEGPFVSPDRLGAQPPFALPPTPERVAEVVATGVVRVVTLAPELDGAEAAARAFAAAGVRVSVGHTRADAATVARIAAAVRDEGGTLGFTHLYNAMGGLEGRAPGVVGACFADADAFAELILDGHHVEPVAFLAARAAKPGRLLLVTDAIRACGLPEGETELGGQRVTVAGGAARLADGTLAGSVLTLDVALRNAVAAGLSLDQAARLVAGVPAAYLGLTDRGRLETGLRADVVELSADLRVRRVFAAGREVAAAAAPTTGVAT
jgi:N-acetylglucosamine-6-phosphate deacetylase